VTVEVSHSDDVLRAANDLLDQVIGFDANEGDERKLALALDRFVASLNYFNHTPTNFIEDVDVPDIHSDDHETRGVICNRFPKLGLYWKALDPIIRHEQEPGIGTGDAIDDLLDISRELKEVVWLHQNHGEA
jgi:hypothetical protein